MFTRRCCYLVEAVGLDYFKIGFTRSLMRRLTFIQTYCPAEIRILALVPGDTHMEAILHRQVSGRRVIGEWFRLDDHIRMQCLDFRMRWPDLWNDFAFEHSCEPILSKFAIADLSEFHEAAIKSLSNSRAKGVANYV